jgi:hypothetical protein
MRILVKAAVILISASVLSGCMCVQKVQNIGVHHLRLHPLDIWTNGCGDRLLSCTLTDYRPASSQSVNLGRRFVTADKSTWADLEQESAAGLPDSRIRRAFRVITACPVTSTSECAFALEPPDTSRKLTPTLPATCEPWTLAEDAAGGSCPHYITTGANGPITIIVCEARIETKYAVYKDSWHAPAQILVIPALILDVVTSPIQFVMIMNSLSRIGK